MTEWRESVAKQTAPVGGMPSGLPRPVDCDGLDVTTHAQDRRMTVHLICPWCADEVAFEVEADSDELQCSACGTSFDFAPDPAVTYALLYEAA
jgi:hypothetical protein